MYLANVDGSCRPNPGKGYYGYILFDEHGQEIARKKGLAGKYITNNIAEYIAVLKVLEHANEIGIKNIKIRSDSELVVRQLNGIYKVKDHKLIDYHKSITRMLKNFDTVLIVHIPREQNKEADSLANFETTDNRLERAQEISTNVFVKTDESYYYIKDNEYYIIDLANKTCTCPDKQNRGGLCKHIMAAQIVEDRVSAILNETVPF